MTIRIGTATNGTARYAATLDDLDRHLYVIGQTGSGKTVLLTNLAAQLLTRNEGFCVIDPHGDFARSLLPLVPLDRRHHLINFDLTDTDRPVGLNFTAGIDPAPRARFADNVVSSFIHIWGNEAIGNRSQQVLRNSLRLVMDAPNTTLLGVSKLLTDRAYRTSLYRTSLDPFVTAYWTDQFDRYDPRKRDDVVSPILNKLDGLLSHPALRNILGSRNTFDLRYVMDNRRILIVNLSKGQIGEQASGFLGSLIVSAIAQQALARDDVPEADRQPFTLLADEFQSFATQSFATILSEARKYRLRLVLAHQFAHQVAEPIRRAVFGNVGTMIALRCGPEDAKMLADHFRVDASALTDLANYRALVRPLVNGAPGTVHFLDTDPPPPDVHGRAEKLIKNSRRRFGRPKEDIERAIAAFLTKSPNEAPNALPKFRQKHTSK